MTRLNISAMSQKNMIYAAVCGYLGALSFGYMIGYSSPSLPQMQVAGEPMYKDDQAASWFGSIATLGALIGCPFGGWCVDRLGRKITLLFTAAPFIAGWLFIHVGSELIMLYTGRFLTGLGSGFVCVVAPLYIAETSTKELRGMLVSGVQLSVTLGILGVYLLGMYVEWRQLALIGAFIPLLLLLATFRVKESPRYLLNTEQRTEAVRSLLWLRGTLAGAEEECRDMEENSDMSEKHLSIWTEFRKPELYRPLLVAGMIMFFQQLSGINVVMFYTVSIFQSAGFDKHTSGLATVFIGLVQVLGTVVACFLMDRSGRRKLLCISGLGMGVTCMMLGFCYLHSSPSDEASLGAAGPKPSPGLTSPERGMNLGWLSVTSLIVYTLSFALGWGPIPMLVTSEIFPAKARGIASSVASLGNWFLAFVVTNQFANLNAALGLHGTFFMFGISCFLSVVFVLRYVPETKGKSLEDIELYFLGRALRGI